MISRLIKEPPFRIFARFLFSFLPVSVDTRGVWEISKRPAYLVGLIQAARQAVQENIDHISVVEMGVAGGNGILALQQEAESVGEAYNIKIEVYGFDTGVGMLGGTDQRDHLDKWKAGDYVMDKDALLPKLGPKTKLVLGDVEDTILSFRQKYNPAPIGFVSLDMDQFEPTVHALTIFNLCETLARVPVYFDDTEFFESDDDYGELRAIREFNDKNIDKIKIRKWRSIRDGRPFPERQMYNQLYVVDDKAKISRTIVERENVQLPLDGS